MKKLPEVCPDDASVPWWENEFNEAGCTDADLIDLSEYESKVEEKAATDAGLIDLSEEEGKVEEDEPEDAFLYEEPVIHDSENNFRNKIKWCKALKEKCAALEDPSVCEEVGHVRRILGEDLHQAGRLL